MQETAQCTDKLVVRVEMLANIDGASSEGCRIGLNESLTITVEEFHKADAVRFEAADLDPESN